MEAGALLSLFDETKGFVYEYYSPENTDVEIIKHTIFRATLFLVGGAEDVQTDRESLLDLPEHDLFGVVYMTSATCPSIRGGKMPIILIYFAPSTEKAPIYAKIASVMSLLKETAFSMKDYWDKKSFSNKKAVHKIIQELPALVKGLISDSSGVVKSISENIQVFDVKCPECGTPARVKVPRNIKRLFSIPIINLPCNHKFEAYFTKGPKLRGTSSVKKEGEKKEELKDIFNNL
ncbi:MAG: hypothetical protein ACTSUE_25050 [Promethearchaeota archaeon]